MLILILFLVVGSLLAYLSQSNMMPVSLFVGPYVFSGIPLFYVIIGSLVAGLLFSYVIHLVQSLSTSWLIRGKENKIKRDKEDILSLTKRVHQLELENEKLKHSPSLEPEDINAL